MPRDEHGTLCFLSKPDEPVHDWARLIGAVRVYVAPQKGLQWVNYHQSDAVRCNCLFELLRIPKGDVARCAIVADRPPEDEESACITSQRIEAGAQDVGRGVLLREVEHVAR